MKATATSLTLYNVHHFFEPNPIKRYSLGTKSKTLKLGPDGSLRMGCFQGTAAAEKALQSGLLPARTKPSPAVGKTTPAQLEEK